MSDKNKKETKQSAKQPAPRVNPGVPDIDDLPQTGGRYQRDETGKLTKIKHIGDMPDA